MRIARWNKAYKGANQINKVDDMFIYQQPAVHPYHTYDIYGDRPYNNTNPFYLKYSMQTDLLGMQTDLLGVVTEYSADGTWGFNFSSQNTLTGLKQMLSGNTHITNCVINHDMSSVTTMQQMFSGCTSLEEATVNLPTPALTSTSWMFDACSSLKVVHLDNMVMDNVTSQSNMFRGCTSLTDIYLNNTSDTTLSKIQTAVATYSSIAPNVTIHRYGWAYTYSNGQWSSTHE